MTTGKDTGRASSKAWHTDQGGDDRWCAVGPWRDTRPEAEEDVPRTGSAWRGKLQSILGLEGHEVSNDDLLDAVRRLRTSADPKEDEHAKSELTREKDRARSYAERLTMLDRRIAALCDRIGAPETCPHDIGTLETRMGIALGWLTRAHDAEVQRDQYREQWLAVCAEAGPNKGEAGLVAGLNAAAVIVDTFMGELTGAMDRGLAYAIGVKIRGAAYDAEQARPCARDDHETREELQAAIAADQHRTSDDPSRCGKRSWHSKPAWFNEEFLEVVHGPPSPVSSATLKKEGS